MIGDVGMSPPVPLHLPSIYIMPANLRESRKWSECGTWTREMQVQSLHAQSQSLPDIFTKYFSAKFTLQDYSQNKMKKWETCKPTMYSIEIHRDFKAKTFSHAHWTSGNILMRQFLFYCH